jgi:hypothetical protein
MIVSTLRQVLKTHSTAPEGIPRLTDDNAATDSSGQFGRDVVLDEAGAGGVTPAGVKHGAKDEPVAPVLEYGGVVGVVRSEKLGGKWHESDDKQERQVNPGEADVGTAQVI